MVSMARSQCRCRRLEGGEMRGCLVAEFRAVIGQFSPPYSGPAVRTKEKKKDKDKDKMIFVISRSNLELCDLTRTLCWTVLVRIWTLQGCESEINRWLKRETLFKTDKFARQSLKPQLKTAD